MLCYTNGDSVTDSFFVNMSPLSYLLMIAISHSASGNLMPDDLLMGLSKQLTQTLEKTVGQLVQNSPMALFQSASSDFEAAPETEADGGQVKVGAGLTLLGNVAVGNDITDETITIYRSPIIQSQVSDRQAGGDKVIEQEEEVRDGGKKSHHEKDGKNDDQKDSSTSTAPATDPSGGVLQLQKAVQQNRKRE